MEPFNAGVAYSNNGIFPSCDCADRGQLSDPSPILVVFFEWCRGGLLGCVVRQLLGGDSLMARKTNAEERAEILSTPIARVAPIPREQFVSSGSTQINLAFSGRPNEGIPMGTYLY